MKDTKEQRFYVLALIELLLQSYLCYTQYSRAIINIPGNIQSTKNKEAERGLTAAHDSPWCEQVGSPSSQSGGKEWKAEVCGCDMKVDAGHMQHRLKRKWCEVRIRASP